MAKHCLFPGLEFTSWSPVGEERIHISSDVCFPRVGEPTPSHLTLESEQKPGSPLTPASPLCDHGVPPLSSTASLSTLLLSLNSSGSRSSLFDEGLS